MSNEEPKLIAIDEEANHQRLLLDSRVVDVPMAYNPTFVMLSSWKPLFFNLAIPRSLLRGYRLKGRV